MMHLIIHPCPNFDLNMLVMRGPWRLAVKLIMEWSQIYQAIAKLSWLVSFGLIDCPNVSDLGHKWIVTCIMFCVWSWVYLLCVDYLVVAPSEKISKMSRTISQSYTTDVTAIVFSVLPVLSHNPFRHIRDSCLTKYDLISHEKFYHNPDVYCNVLCNVERIWYRVIELVNTFQEQMQCTQNCAVSVLLMGLSLLWKRGSLWYGYMRIVEGISDF